MNQPQQKPLLPYVEMNPKTQPHATIIWLHGLGADGHDFESIVPQLQNDNYPIRFIFPHAPFRSITINDGLQMRAWYDVKSFDFKQGQDEEGIRESSNALSQLIELEAQNGISNGKIILAGFSQGGAIAIHTALRYPKKLGGVIALSTYLPLANSLEQEANPANKTIPIFMGHGESDPLIQIDFARYSRNVLENNGYQIEWHEYKALEHGVCLEEIQNIRQWLANHFI